MALFGIRAGRFAPEEGGGSMIFVPSGKATAGMAAWSSRTPRVAYHFNFVKLASLQINEQLWLRQNDEKKHALWRSL